jgi:hypothetical protein
MNISRNQRPANDLSRLLFYAGCLIALYIILIFSLPVDQTAKNFDLEPLQYRIVRLAVSIPAMLTWLAAFAGYGMLRQYTAAIRRTPDGPHFELLTKGAGWLAWSLPVPIITALILRSLPGMQTPAVIIINYVSLLLPLIAFSLIGTATRGLANSTPLKLNLANARLIMLVFLALGVTYCWLIFRQFNPSSLGSSDNPYFMPAWLVVVTLIVPYLYAWFAGLLAAYEISLYSRQVSGVLYRQALRLLAGGLIIVIIGSIGLQYLSAVQVLAGKLMLDYRLLVIWLFRLITIGGFVMLFVGAARLKKIEEV